MLLARTYTNGYTGLKVGETSFAPREIVDYSRDILEKAYKKLKNLVKTDLLGLDAFETT